MLRGSLGLPTPSPRKIPNIKTEHHAPFSVNPTRGRGECGQGAGIWCQRLSPCRAFDHAKWPRGLDIWLWPTEAWYQFRSSYQVCPLRLSESHAVGERYGVFICFNRCSIRTYARSASLHCYYHVTQINQFYPTWRVCCFKTVHWRRGFADLRRKT